MCSHSPRHGWETPPYVGDELTDVQREQFASIYGWLYWIATFTAGLTALYTFRAFFMTFYGEELHPAGGGGPCARVSAGDVGPAGGIGGRGGFGRRVSGLVVPARAQLVRGVPIAHAIAFRRADRIDGDSQASFTGSLLCGAPASSPRGFWPRSTSIWEVGARSKWLAP